jgi:hypothetical protein
MLLANTITALSGVTSPGGPYGSGLGGFRVDAGKGKQAVQIGARALRAGNRNASLPDQHFEGFATWATEIFVDRHKAISEKVVLNPDQIQT